MAGSRSAHQSEDEPEPHRNAFEIDSLIALDEDPFAAYPPTPVTPVAPHNTPVETTPHQQSFMSFANNSGASVSGSGKSDSKPSTKSIADSRTVASADWRSASTPTLLTAPAEQGRLTRDLRSARKLPDRHSGLPPSLVVALDRGHVNRITSTTPASPTYPGDATEHAVGPGQKKEIRLHVNTVLGRVRRTQHAPTDSVNSLSGLSEASRPGSQASSPGAIIGHSSSRPHSPFPFLFLRSKHANGRGSALSGSDFSAQEAETFPEDVRRRADTPIPDVKSVTALREVRVKDLSNSQGKASCSATLSVPIPECDEPEEVVRDMASSTAWFLESDDEKDEVEDKERSPCVGLGLKLTASPPGSVTGCARGAAVDDARSILSMKSDDRVSTLLRPRSALNVGLDIHSTKNENPIESETEIDNEAKSGASWPLPPIRTFVVDEETGEGWHDVEPTVEVSNFDELLDRTTIHNHSFQYAPNDALFPESTKVRHSIRSIPSSNRSASSCSHSTPDSKSGGSPTCQRIGSEQARVIVEKLGYNLDSVSRPPSQLKRRSQVRSVRSCRASIEPSSASTDHRSRERSNSSASAVSISSTGTGSRSYRTCRSGFSPARSSGSFRSSRSVSSSSSHSGGHTGNISLPRSNSSRSSRVNSTQPCAPTSFALARPSSRWSSSARKSELLNVQVHLAMQRMKQDAIPQRVVLRDESPANAMTICAESWTSLMAFCKQNENLLLEAAETEDHNTKLIVTLEEVQVQSNGASPSKRSLRRQSDSEFCEQRMPGGLPVSPPTHSSAGTLILLTLTHGKGNEAPTDSSKARLLAFTIPLPTTLSQIAQQSRASVLGEGLKAEERT